tara:strand:- start:24773 stop:25588 length:816 start_codon:yes stop_codon:yes gene_type:complete
MILNKTSPTTPSQRNLIRLNNSDLVKRPFIKSNIKGTKNSDGTNHSGKITSRHKGGGNKIKYRKINFTRTNISAGVVITIEYDPYRSGNIASVYDYNTKTYYYVLAPSGLRVGDIIKSGINADVSNGHSLPISKIPSGSLIHNVSVKETKKSQVSRSAGTFSQLIEKTPTACRIQLSSGEQRYVSPKCFATIGVVSNESWFLTTIGKAGRARWLNKRPKVRGVAMNPVDHPHGGGEGKTSGGRTSVTPWGKPTKNRKTSRSKNTLIINKRR